MCLVTAVFGVSDWDDEEEIEMEAGEVQGRAGAARDVVAAWMPV